MMTLAEALEFADSHGSIEPTDEEVEAVLAAEIHRLRDQWGDLVRWLQAQHHDKPGGTTEQDVLRKMKQLEGRRRT